MNESVETGAANQNQGARRPQSRLVRWIKRLFVSLCILVAIFFAALLIYFPGRQFPMAITLATGLGVSGLQERVDALEQKAISGTAFTDEDKVFLHNLYTCFAKGGRLTIVLRQSAAMMERYLSCSGETLFTAPRIFLGSGRVREQMDILRQQILQDQLNGSGLEGEYKTDVFYMGDPDFPDSIVGLYDGTLSVKVSKDTTGQQVLHWRAEVPWQWPTYESLYVKYGDKHAQCFPLPNAMCLVRGSRGCLWIDDGLGEYLARLELAKPFLVYSEWDESAKPEQP